MTQRNLTKVLLGLGILTISLVGCMKSECDYSDHRGGKPITFTSNISVDPSSLRVFENTWEKDDQIAVYMIESGTTLPSFNENDVEEKDFPYRKSKYKALNRGVKVNFEALDAKSALMFPEDGAVDFIAYYPASLTPSETKLLAVDLVNNPVDLLYSNELKGKSSATNPDELELTFKHALASIRVAFTLATGDLLVVDKPSLHGLKTQANFSLVDGSISDVKGTGDITPMCKYDRYYDAVVIPQDIKEGKVKLSLSYQGEHYEFALPAIDIPQGKRVRYEVVLNAPAKTQPEMSGTIEEWSEVAGGKGTLKPSAGSHTTGSEPVLTEAEKKLLEAWKTKFDMDLKPFLGTMICNGTVRENGEDLLPMFAKSRLVPIRNQKMTVEISKQATEDMPILSFTKNALGLANYWRDVWLLLTWENREFWNDPRHPYVAPAVKNIVKALNWTEDTYVEFDVAMPIIKIDPNNKGAVLFTGTKTQAVTGMIPDAKHTAEQLDEMARDLDPVYELYYDSENLDNAIQFNVPLYKKLVELTKLPEWIDKGLRDDVQGASISPFQIMDTKTIKTDTWKDDIDHTQYEEPKGTIDFVKKEIHIRTISSLENSGYTLIDITCKATR